MIPKLATVTKKTAAEVPSVLYAFRDASPKLLDTRTLQQRVDRKYLLPKRVLEPLLARLSGEYQVIRSAGQLAAAYSTQYFDTPERQMYHDHRRGRRPRYKVRLRHHLDRRLNFLEVKRRGSDERTTKTRLDRPFGDSTLDEKALAFVEQHCPVRADALIPLLSVAYYRITLVGEHVNERITFDLALELRDDHRCDHWPHVVVVEIKQARYTNDSPAVRALRGLHVRGRSVSKYCLATAMLAAVRCNRFRPTLRAMEQLSA